MKDSVRIFLVSASGCLLIIHIQSVCILCTLAPFAIQYHSIFNFSKYFNVINSLEKAREKQTTNKNEPQTEYSDYFYCLVLVWFAALFWMWLFGFCIWFNWCGLCKDAHCAQLYDYLSVFGAKDGSFDVCRSLNRCGYRILMCAQHRTQMHSYIYRSRYEIHCIIVLYVFFRFFFCLISRLRFDIRLFCNRFTGNRLQTFNGSVCKRDGNFKQLFW